MSFSKRCKKEISLKLIKDENLSMELFSYIRLAGYLRIVKGQFNVYFDADYKHQAKRIYNIIKRLYNYSPTIEIKESNKFGKEDYYTVFVEKSSVADKILEDTKVLTITDSKEIYDSLYSDEFKKIFLQDAFLLYGSINDPNRGYYVEISIQEKELVKVLLDIMKYFNLNPKTINRNDTDLIYMKDGDRISDFLSIIRAYKSLLELEDVRAMKSLRNDINRQTNCDKANITRTVNASIKQVNSIKKLKESNIFYKLDEELQQIANLREENPYLSLEELGKMLNPQMSKAKVNYRLQKINKIANEIK
ncbi:MAG: DNA-binding protein WhiA [Tissierellia bacterium]|nr:DNA-binding protein WhiA [Tissierellia bacterium]